MYIFHLQIVVSSYLSNLMPGPKVKGKKKEIRKGKKYFSATVRILKYEQINEAPEALAT
jgi:hypothetical protein